MELLMVVAGILLLWKFATSLNALAIGTRAKAEVFAESIIADCVQERTENFEEHLKAMEGKKTYAHSEIMEHFKVGD